MSTRVMGLVWDLKMPASAKIVLVSLADQANDAGVCWPSVDSMCRRTCMSDRGVQKALRWLEDQGLVVSERRVGSSNRYTVVVPAEWLEAGGDSPERGVNHVHPERRSPRTTFTEGVNHVHPGGEPRSPKPTKNRKENRQEEKETRAADAAASVVCPDDVSADVWRDWLEIRKRKRLPLTPTAWAGMQREIERTGLGNEDALRLCCTRGWASLDHRWLQPQGAIGSAASRRDAEQADFIARLTGRASRTLGDVIDAEPLPALPRR